MHIADSQYIIKLHSGRKISLEENYQNLTYLGLLEGLPNKQMNDNIINLDDKLEVSFGCVSRPESASPATGNSKIHKETQEKVIKDAFKV